MKRNVLFISMGMHAFGEAILALNLARGLPSSRYEVCLVISPLTKVLVERLPGIQAITMHRRATKINRIVLEDFLERYPPDIIVLCDFVTFDFSQAMFGITYNLLAQCGVPIVSIDSYEWESGEFVLDFFSGFEMKIPKTLLSLDGALRPCPINKPAPLNGRTACYSFFSQVDLHQGSGFERLRRDLGIAPDDFVVFTADAMWQVRAESRHIPRTDLANQLLGLHLSRLERRVHWIRVGPAPELRVPLDRVVEHRFDSLPEEEFTCHLRASDLVISTNVSSTTLAKAVSYGKPALLLSNSRVINGPRDLPPYCVSEPGLELLEPAYPVHPFYMFPLGWYKFLTPVLTGNPYLRTFHRAELLDEAGIASILRQAARGRLPTLRAERERYLESLASLPSPGECLEHFISGKPAESAARVGT